MKETLLVAGILCIFGYIVLHKSCKGNHLVLFSGLFFIVSSLWLLTETEWAFACLPLSLSALFYCFFSGKKKVFFAIVFWISLVAVIVTSILLEFKIWKYQGTMYFASLILLLLLALAGGVFSIESGVRRRREDHVWIDLGVLLLCMGVLIEILRACRFGCGFLYWAYSVGASAFLLCFGIYLCRQLLSIIAATQEVEHLKQLAYIDTLTMLPNRTAYDREIQRIENSKEGFSSITCIIFDLNYLKVTNDTSGHKAGDELIRGTGYCIQKTFQNMGMSFRLGGDEFASILLNLTEDEVVQGMNALYENMTEYNENHEFKIDISWGVAREEKEPDVRRLLGKADARMYENKRLMKAL